MTALNESKVEIRFRWMPALHPEYNELLQDVSVWASQNDLMDTKDTKGNGERDICNSGTTYCAALVPDLPKDKIQFLANLFTYLIFLDDLIDCPESNPTPEYITEAIVQVMSGKEMEVMDAVFHPLFEGYKKLPFIEGSCDARSILATESKNFRDACLTIRLAETNQLELSVAKYLEIRRYDFLFDIPMLCDLIVRQKPIYKLDWNSAIVQTSIRHSIFFVILTHDMMIVQKKKPRTGQMRLANAVYTLTRTGLGIQEALKNCEALRLREEALMYEGLELMKEKFQELRSALIRTIGAFLTAYKLRVRYN